MGCVFRLIHLDSGCDAEVPEKSPFYFRIAKDFAKAAICSLYFRPIVVYRLFITG